MAESDTTTSPLVQELTARLSEPDWLAKRRVRTAYETYRILPLRDWRRPICATVRGIWLPFPGQPTPVASDDAATLLEAAARVATCVRARRRVAKCVVHAGSSAEQGVIFTDLHTAVRDHEALVKEHLGSVVPADEAKWTALNPALLARRRVRVRAKARAELKTPIQFVYAETEAAAGRMLACSSSSATDRQPVSRTLKSTCTG